jgi:hypothetical protein
VTGVTQGSNGSTRFDKSNIYYTPNAGFSGTDLITFTIVDNKGRPYTQSFDINIANLPPVANPDTASVYMNSSNNVIDVLANDTDPGNDALIITAVDTTGSSGTVIILPGGLSLTYTPNAGYVGNDSFTYTINDTNGGQATGTVNVGVSVPPWCGNATGHPSSVGCLISNVRLNGVSQTTLTVAGPGDTFAMQFDYQVWVLPGATTRVQVMPGMESTFSGTCAFDGVPGGFPGDSGTSAVFTLTAPASSGSWAVFINRAFQFSCVPTSYLGYGEVIALITVP